MPKEPSMKVSQQVEGTPSGDYGIAAALAETLEAAVFADSRAANKAYELIERYAYGTSNPSANERQLQMAHFAMRDSAGNMQDISIPIITMMPLPLLHVTEVTFDLDLNVHLHNIEEETVSMQAPGSTVTPRSGIRVPTPINTTQHTESAPLLYKRLEAKKLIQSLRTNRVGISAKEHFRRYEECRSLRLELRQLLFQEEQRKNTAQEMTPSTQGITGSHFVVSHRETENTTTTHVRVNVKMQQHQLPDGIKSLLQAASNSLTVKPL